MIKTTRDGVGVPGSVPAVLEEAQQQPGKHDGMSGGNRNGDSRGAKRYCAQQHFL